MNAHAATFERYYESNDDPWGFRTRWYERRKRALLLASLPHETYTSAWEIGCSNGELAAALAPRCENLLATDGNATAVKTARLRLAEYPGARVDEKWVPEQWPAQQFDLIVLSEMAYYLDEATLRKLSQRLAGTLKSGGCFLACHWRAPIEGCALNGDDVHRILEETLPWQKLAHHLESDFVLEIWSADPLSVAQQEGLR